MDDGMNYNEVAKRMLLISPDMAAVVLSLMEMYAKETGCSGAEFLRVYKKTIEQVLLPQPKHYEQAMSKNRVYDFHTEKGLITNISPSDPRLSDHKYLETQPNPQFIEQVAKSILEAVPDDLRDSGMHRSVVPGFVKGSDRKPLTVIRDDPSDETPPQPPMMHFRGHVELVKAVDYPNARKMSPWAQVLFPMGVDGYMAFELMDDYKAWRDAKLEDV